uniref:Cytochrome P450 9e2 n=1 Tax=Lygus hesperus TaxID=30085 RepID=A0A146KMA9_LYGHE
MELCGSLNYESVNAMEFLDRVIKEVLRKHPPVIFIPRICTKGTNIPGTSFHIEEGTQLLIPVLALHRDPKYFPYPEEFLPQRFASLTNKISLPETPYLPFSEGPRKCIGMRFAILEVKIALAKIVSEFDLELDGTSPRIITVEEYARTYKMKDQIKIIFKRKNYMSRDSSSKI